jgi:hypothetical protein
MPAGWQRCAAACAALAIAASAWVASASGSTTHDIRGTWQTPGVFSAIDTINTVDLASGKFTGRGVGTNGTGYTWPNTGTVTGNKVTWQFGPYDQLASYTATCKGTLSADGASISGTCTDTFNHPPGAWTITRTSTSISGETAPVGAAPVSGTVVIKEPGASGFVPLSAATTLFSGVTVDATKGTVKLTAQSHSADFYEGAFTLGRTRAGTTTLKLAGGTPCPGVAAATAAPRQHQRKLWGSGHGSFQTTGHYAAATVLGTKWLTQDTCAGTLIRVAEGHVRVRDLVRHTTIVLHAPQSYLAKP